MKVRIFLPLVVALAAVAAGAAEAETREAPERLRAEFRALLINGRAPSELKPQVVSSTTLGRSTVVERVRFTPEEGHDAVAVIHRPTAAGRHPVVILQHFLGGSKDHLALAPLFHQLAQRGFLVAAIDGRYRGDRQNGTSLEAAMLAALRAGPEAKERPFLLDTAYDVLRLIDYLVTRPDVDPGRIGMTGISEGGLITWMVAAAEPRIQVAVPIIGVTTFADALAEEDGPDTRARVALFDSVLREYAKDLGEPAPNGRVLRAAWAKLVPGMLDRFDAPHLLPLIAPRPMLILNHASDEIFPLTGAEKAHAAALARYRETGAADRLELRVAPGKHASFNLTHLMGMVQWMERWLKPAPAAARTTPLAEARERWERLGTAWRGLSFRLPQSIAVARR